MRLPFLRGFVVVCMWRRLVGRGERERRGRSEPRVPPRGGVGGVGGGRRSAVPSDYPLR